MTTAEKTKIAVFISGRGSNLGALIEACRDPSFPACIAVVLADRVGTEGVLRAEQAGISTHVVARSDHPSRESFEAAIVTVLRGTGTDLICLAGFMNILSATFVSAWREKIMNIHPSLLPAFKGTRVHERVLAAGVKITGCTVHFVTPDLDDGPIIAQAAVPVFQNDNTERLALRVLQYEHRLYPLALYLVAAKKFRIENGIVSFLSSDYIGDTGLMNPSFQFDDGCIDQ